MFTAALVEKRRFISPDLEAAGPGKPVRLLDYACGPGTVSRVSFSFSGVRNRAVLLQNPGNGPIV